MHQAKGLSKLLFLGLPLRRIPSEGDLVTGITWARYLTLHNF
jgi:hypothetical protein